MTIKDNITKEVVITADSTCDLPEHIVEKNQIIIFFAKLTNNSK